MAKHKLHPEPGETWYHPITFNAYQVHSLSDDGWVRYRVLMPTGELTKYTPLFTEPTLDFVRKYKRQETNNA